MTTPALVSAILESLRIIHVDNASSSTARQPWIARSQDASIAHVGHYRSPETHLFHSSTHPIPHLLLAPLPTSLATIILTPNQLTNIKLQSQPLATTVLPDRVATFDSTSSSNSSPSSKNSRRSASVVDGRLYAEYGTPGLPVNFSELDGTTVVNTEQSDDDQASETQWSNPHRQAIYPTPSVVKVPRLSPQASGEGDDKVGVASLTFSFTAPPPPPHYPM